MFASNQIFKISGELSNIEKALEFALKYSGYGTRDICYQIAKDGRYCIGLAPDGVPEEGWINFQFDFDVSIVSKIIAQHLAKTPVEEGFFDGGYYKGFLMENIENMMGDEYNGIKRPSYGIVSFAPYSAFYAK